MTSFQSCSTVNDVFGCVSRILALSSRWSDGMRRMMLCRTLFLAALCMLPIAGRAQTLSEERALAELLREAARESALRVHGASVTLGMTPESLPVLVTQVFVEELQRRGIAVRTGSASQSDHMHVDMREMNFSTVSSENSSYLRTLTAVFGVLVHSKSEDVHRWSKEFTLQRIDTLARRPARSGHDWLEASSDPWTTVLEPALIVLAGAVILVLLFTVRGSS
jgi:hypothetical protein